MTTRYVDLSGGNDSNDGSSFANRCLTIGASGMTAARHAAGDVIRIMKSPDPTTLTTTALWTNASRTITLTTAVNKTFDNGSAWTNSANVTGTTATGKISNATNHIIGGPFGTGLVAYKDLGSTQDFSAYQQLSFWMKCSIAVAGSVFQIKLCSDAAGATPVNTITITQAIDNTSVWQAIVLDNGSALSSTVRSIALYASSDPGAVTVNLNNIIAAKAPGNADCLTLHSLLSKSNAPTGVTGWYRPASISGTAIVYDAGINSLANAARTYEGTTETVTTYVRQCIPIKTGGATAMAVAQLAGTDGNMITYSGGWNTTDMTTQTGQTFVILWEGFQSGFSFNAKDFIAVEKLGIGGALPGFLDGGQSNNCTLTDCWAIGCSNAFNPSNASSGGWTLTRCYAFNCTTNSIVMDGALSLRNTLNSCVAVGGLVGSPFLGNKNTYFKNCIARNNVGTGFLMTNGNGDEYQLDTCQSSLMSSADLSISSSAASSIKCINCTWSTGLTLPSTARELAIYSINDANTADNAIITSACAVVTQQAAVRHTASGTAWKIAPTSSTLSSLNPFRFKIADLAVAASALVTVKAWVRRDNTGIDVKLVCPALADIVATEVTATITVGANTWEELTITFTPGAPGVVPIYIQSYGGTTFLAYVDDTDMSQA